MDTLSKKEVEMNLKEIAEKLKAEGMRCNCDLDNWQPEKTTGHSCVCRIHKKAQWIRGQQVVHMATKTVQEWNNG